VGLAVGIKVGIEVGLGVEVDVGNLVGVEVGTRVGILVGLGGRVVGLGVKEGGGVVWFKLLMTLVPIVVLEPNQSYLPLLAAYINLI